MNKLILFLSTPSRNQEEKTYKSDMGDFIGVNSSDAPSEYILQYAHSNGNTLDEIICIVTEESKEKSLDEYKNLISRYCGDKDISAPQIKDILYSNNISQSIKSITENIEKDDNIFIDTTGGFRDISYILLFIVRFLEYAGINFKKAIYGNYNDLSITDVTSTYKLFNLINSADNFISFGNSKALSKIFDNTSNPYIKNLIQSMNDFSNAISLCRTKNIENIFIELNDNLNALENNINTDDGYELLFYQMTDLIKQKFHLDKPSFDYINIINWCLDNNLIQQAITIYTDKIPTYLIKKEYFSCSNNVWKQAEKSYNNNRYYEILYNHLFKMELKNCSLKSFLDIKDIVPNLESSKNLDDFKKKSIVVIEKIDCDIPEIRNGISNILALKRVIYNMKGERNSKEYIKENLQNYNKSPKYDILLNMSINDLKAETFEGMISQIKNNERVIKDLQKNLNKEVDSNNESNKRINIIENLGVFLNSNKDDYKVNISQEDFQNILRDYLYVKSWIRNVINHAGDECSISNFEKEYYKNHGYSIDEDLSVDDIIKIMREVLDRIININPNSKYN